MDELNINVILQREGIYKEIVDILTNFESNKHSIHSKKGIYIYGSPGCGKTHFVTHLLKNLDYDVIKYDAGDVLNKSVIQSITKYNSSDKSIFQLFHKKIKRIAIVMDEMDGINSGDNECITSLIKLVRPKKTKKQKNEEMTINTIICIGENSNYKKIKELMKVCYTFELKSPSSLQIENIMKSLSIFEKYNDETRKKMANFIQGDLRKFKQLYNIIKENTELNIESILGEKNDSFFQLKSYNDNTKNIVVDLFKSPFSLEKHTSVMNETDRTVVGLLWHENIVDIFSKNKIKFQDSLPLYLKMLDNLCFADYIDRITFQKQIWQFNEMSSIIKTFKNNHLFHRQVPLLFEKQKKTVLEKCDNIQDKLPFKDSTDVRFTKVLCKYSTEYNNSVFLQKMCNEFGFDKKDLFTFFINYKNQLLQPEIINEITEQYDISKLDIQRMIRFLEKKPSKEDVELNDEQTVHFEE